jgi:predicted ATP-grasp superfamily ATP-dependent carboligase
MGPVLVLDGDQVSTLAIVRSLGRGSIVVDVASAAGRPLAGFSRHVRSCLRHPDPMRDEDAFVAWLEHWTREHPSAIVIPVTERTVVPIHQNRHRLAMDRIAIAPRDALEQVLDKDRTLALAASLGVPVPRSTLICSIDEIESAAAGHAFPIVVKPSRSVGQDGERRVHLAVSYAQNAGELFTQVRHALAFGAVLLQDYFAGDGVGVELIADRGEVRYAFQHRRLHEVPLTGGGSSLRVSEPPVPALLQAATALMQALRWHGVAMVEFKYAPGSGDFRLMEINGRFWGSLPLAVAAGADFPLMLHELMTGGVIRPRAAARSGIVCRQLSRDIDWLEQVLRGSARGGPVRLPTRRQALSDALLVFSRSHRFDVQSLSDPLPGFVDAWRIVRRQAERLATAARFRLRLAWAIRQAKADHGTARRRTASARSVLFVCYGNINRSALAEAHAAERYAGRAQFASAGFHAIGGRPADPVMVATALTHGIDLSNWHSRTLTSRAIDEADVVFVMELQHADRVLREYPSAHGKVVLLGAALASHAGTVEIPDPYGREPEFYRRVCRQVVDGVDAWLAPRAGV